MDGTHPRVLPRASQPASQPRTCILGLRRLCLVVATRCSYPNQVAFGPGGMPRSGAGAGIETDGWSVTWWGRSCHAGAGGKRAANVGGVS